MMVRRHHASYFLTLSIYCFRAGARLPTRSLARRPRRGAEATGNAPLRAGRPSRRPPHLSPGPLQSCCPPELSEPTGRGVRSCPARSLPLLPEPGVGSRGSRVRMVAGSSRSCSLSRSCLLQGLLSVLIPCVSPHWIPRAASSPAAALSAASAGQRWSLVRKSHPSPRLSSTCGIS